MIVHFVKSAFSDGQWYYHIIEVPGNFIFLGLLDELCVLENLVNLSLALAMTHCMWFEYAVMALFWFNLRNTVDCTLGISIIIIFNAKGI